MARVLSPSGIPLNQPAGPEPVRASPASFGAPVAEAIDQTGRSLSTLGHAIDRISEKRRGLEDAAFADKADLALDLAYGKISQEEENKARAGGAGMVDSVRQRFDSETPGILEKLQTEGGLRPSPEALQKAQNIAIQRQHQHLTKAAVYENNERVRFIGDQLDNSLNEIANAGARSGDIGSALDRAEQSIQAYKGILTPAQLDQMREQASKHFYNQLAANADPEAVLQYAQELQKRKPQQADNGSSPEDGAYLSGSEAPSGPAKPAQNDAIGKAAAATGVDDGLLRVFAKIESGGKANAQTGSYKGLFQLSDTEFNKHGGGNIFNAEDNAMAAAQKLKEEAAQFQEKYGRQPTPTDLYLIHQQGEAGYDAHLSNPNAPAWQNMLSTGEGKQKGAAWAKAAIWGNVPDDMKKRFGSVDNVTSQDFIDLWNEKVQRIGGNAVGLQGDFTDNTIRGALARTLSEQGPKLVEAAEKAKEKRLLRERSADVLAGRMPVDPGSKDDQKTLNKIFDATGLATKLTNNDPQAAAAVTAFAEKTSYVPDGAISQLRAMSSNGSQDQKIYAYETAANVMRVKPGAFENSDKAKSLKDDASLYQTLTVDLGLPANAAISRIDELNSPEFAKRAESLKKNTDDIVKKLTPGDVTSDYGGWFTSTPDAGGSPRQAGEVFDAYRNLVRENYIRTGDENVAKAMAKQQLGKAYGISEVTDKKRLMRTPPENYYPKIEPRAGKEPDLSYFSDQLHAAVNDAARGAGRDLSDVNTEARGAIMGAQSQAKPEIPLKDIYIEPVPQTAIDIRAGRPPGYGVVWFEDRDGIRVMNTAPGMVFRADVKGEMERQQRNREQRVRDERQREIDRREALENDPTRKAFKAIGNAINDDFSKPLAERTITAPVAPGIPSIN